MDKELVKLKQTAQKQRCKSKQRTELQEAIAFIKQLRAELPEVESMLFHIPNGGFRGGAEARNLVLSGVKAGVPDYFLAYPVTMQIGSMIVPRHGLFIELKRALTPQGTKGGRVSRQQIDWCDKLKNKGYECVVCWGASEAIEAVKNYLRER